MGGVFCFAPRVWTSQTIIHSWEIFGHSGYQSIAQGSLEPAGWLGRPERMFVHRERKIILDPSPGLGHKVPNPEQLLR